MISQSVLWVGLTLLSSCVPEPRTGWNNNGNHDMFSLSPDNAVSFNLHCSTLKTPAKPACWHGYAHVLTSGGYTGFCWYDTDVLMRKNQIPLPHRHQVEWAQCQTEDALCNKLTIQSDIRQIHPFIHAYLLSCGSSVANWQRFYSRSLHLVKFWINW